MPRMTALLNRLFLFACLFVSPAALGQTYPDRTVTIVVTSAAGALTDVLTRAIAQSLSEMWKQSVIVENRGGAGYSIAAQSVMRAERDGLTLLSSETAIWSIQPHLYAKDKLSYDAERDFVPVSGYGTIPMALIVNPSVPAKSLSELLALARQKPGAVTFGSAGVGAAPYLACAMVTAAIGATAVTHVPYRSSAPALQDLISGTIDYYCPVSVAAMPLIANKSAKVIAVLTRERSPLFPDLPTAAEEGLNVVDGYYWMALFLPKATPENVVEILNKAIGVTLDTPAVQARLKDVATTVVPASQRSTAYLQKYVETEIVKWAGIMRTANVPQQ